MSEETKVGLFIIDVLFWAVLSFVTYMFVGHAVVEFISIQVDKWFDKKEKK